MSDAPPFDATKPFTRAPQQAAPPFDPSKPFTAAPATPDRPDTRGKARMPAEEPGLSVMDHLWRGIMGKDATVPGRVGMGMGDAAVGMVQMGARAPVVPEAMPFMPPEMASAAQADTKAVDAAVQQREHSYEGTRQSAQPGEKLATDWMRILGNVASPVNLAAGGAAGAAMRGAGTAGKVALSTGLGATMGASEPVTGKNYAAEKAAQIGFGAMGGAVGGAVGTEAGSLLGRAIAGNSPQAVDAYITSKFRRAVKPSRVGQDSAPKLDMQDQRILTAVDQIIANRTNLTFADPASGQPIRGQLPRSLKQFGDSIDQTKTKIFDEYDAIARSAGDKGVRVDLAPVAQKLREVAQMPEVVDFHPNLIAEAERLAQTMEARASYTPKEAQGVIQNLNETLSGFYRNPTNETVSHSAMLGPVARMLREGLDSAIEAASGPGYQALKLRYGALRSIEKDVAGAVQREANKVSGGIGGIFSDIAASEEAIRGVITANPGALMRAGGIKAAQQAMKYIHSPNRAIDRLFQRASRRGPPASPARQAVGSGIEYSFPVMGGMTGGELGGQMQREPRPSAVGP